MLIALAALILIIYLYHAMAEANQKSKELFKKTIKMQVTEVINLDHKTAEEWQKVPLIKVINVRSINDKESEVIFEYDIRETKWIFWQMYKWGQHTGMMDLREQIITKNTNNATAY